MIAISFKLFGINEWAYRLPALLFFLLSLIYTYLFSKKYYNQDTALTAVLILATALHVILSNTDVRAEPYLMGLLTGSIFHITNLKDRLKIRDLFLAALLGAAAIMTKGVFVIIPVCGSLLAHLFFTKNFKQLYNIKWLWLVILTLLFLTPEFYSLYLQFDLHPEKTVFNTTHVSGIRWFLWDSQFGRFVNNGPISRKVQGSVFFYLHTLIWAFAPWCLIFYFALYQKFKFIYNKQQQPEYYALGGGLSLLIIFSLSRFQLPFYTNAVFPLFAIIAAPILNARLTPVSEKFKVIALWVFITGLPIAVLILNYFVKPGNNLFFGLDCLLFFIAINIISVGEKSIHKVFLIACCSALFVGFYLNIIFYRVLTAYNGQIAAARYINLIPFRYYPIYTLNERDNAFQFYCNKQVIPISIEQFRALRNSVPALFYARQRAVDDLNKTNTHFVLIRSFVNYPQENILPRFINPKTRYQVLNRVYIICKPKS